MPEAKHLTPCPWCRTSEHLRAGHVECMKFAVECMRCKCQGPTRSYGDVCGTDERILDEYVHLIDREGDGIAAYKDLDEFLLAWAVALWEGRVMPGEEFRLDAIRDRPSGKS